MTAQTFFDAADFAQLGAAIGKLPQDIRTKATARAMRRVTEMARTRLVRRQAPRLKLTQAQIRERTTAMFNAGGNTAGLVVRSSWIPLHKLGATQGSRGVRVRLRGSYKSAFIARMASGHTGVMKRVGTERLPIRELYGPNPAHDITNNEDVYLQLMAEVMEDVLLPRMLHELSRLLPK